MINVPAEIDRLKHESKVCLYLYHTTHRAAHLHYAIAYTNQALWYLRRQPRSI